MNESIAFLLSLLSGIALGAVFFGGLWITVQCSTSAAHPAALFAGSLLLRIAVVLGGFYCLVQANWRFLLMGSLGFLAARMVIVRLALTDRFGLASLIKRSAP